MWFKKKKKTKILSPEEKSNLFDKKFFELCKEMEVPAAYVYLVNDNAGNQRAVIKGDNWTCQQVSAWLHLYSAAWKKGLQRGVNFLKPQIRAFKKNLNEKRSKIINE